MLTKIVAVQARMGKRLSLPDMIHIFKQRPDFVCLPEYWLIDESIGDFHRAALQHHEYMEYLRRLSEELTTCLIGGTVVESEQDRLFNSCPVMRNGVLMASYRKRYPVPGEQAKGIQPGSGNLVFDVDGVRIGIMICGDVLYPETYGEMRRAKVDVIFVPTTSPYRPDDTPAAKQGRDLRYFVDGAASSGAYVVKVCGVGVLFGRRLQGRSSVAAPWGMLACVGYDDEFSERILTVTLDIDEIREFRRKASDHGVSVR
ncbi:MAG: carbon-nitrogen hydrolase family protein [Candidatus Zixiibacteriota bacterium]